MSLEKNSSPDDKSTLTSPCKKRKHSEDSIDPSQEEKEEQEIGIFMFNLYDYVGDERQTVTIRAPIEDCKWLDNVIGDESCLSYPQRAHTKDHGCIFNWFWADVDERPILKVQNKSTLTQADIDRISKYKRTSQTTLSGERVWSLGDSAIYLDE